MSDESNVSGKLPTNASRIRTDHRLSGCFLVFSAFSSNPVLRYLVSSSARDREAMTTKQTRGSALLLV